MIFYFSATGNSKWLAQKIAKRIGDETIDIETIGDVDSYSHDMKSGEVLGFVFPVYFCAMPDIVERFIQKLKVKTGDQYYAFVAVTCGNSFGTTIRSFRRAMLRQGLTVSASFELRTIDTFLPFFQIPDGDARQKAIDDSCIQADMICRQIADRSIGEYERKTSFQAAQSIALGVMYKLMRHTAYLHVSDACTGCGTCANHCPLHAIEIDPETQKPKWILDKCMMCLRCVHHCPKSAIDYSGFTKGKLRYRATWDEV